MGKLIKPEVNGIPTILLLKKLNCTRNQNILIFCKWTEFGFHCWWFWARESNFLFWYWLLSLAEDQVLRWSSWPLLSWKILGKTQKQVALIEKLWTGLGWWRVVFFSTRCVSIMWPQQKDPESLGVRWLPSLGGGIAPICVCSVINRKEFVQYLIIFCTGSVTKVLCRRATKVRVFHLSMHLSHCSFRVFSKISKTLFLELSKKEENLSFKYSIPHF